MSDVPSWLTEDDTTKKAAVTLAKNPAVQNAAFAAAKDPNVQAAAFSAARQSLSKSDPNAPSWANNDPPPLKGGSGAGGDMESGNSSRQIQSQPETEIDPDTLRRMKNWHLLLRLSYMSAAILMAAASVISLEIQPDVGLAFFAVYVFVFSILIFCFEVNLSICARPLAINFGFLYTPIGRCIFLLFVSFMVFSLQLPLAYAAFAVLLAVGLLHLVILCKFPRFEDYLRRLHYFSAGRGK